MENQEENSMPFISFTAYSDRSNKLPIWLMHAKNEK